MTTTIPLPPLADARSTPPPPPAEQQPADPAAPRHFDFVDSLRGLAIVGVVMVHAMFCIPDLHGRVKVIAGQGQYGVQLFFVVSAFTLFWSLRGRRSAERRPLAAFYARRFFRIAPLFWVGVAYYLLVPLPNRPESAPNGVGWPHALATLLFVHGWYPSTINSVVPGGWSIAAEAMFYLCIPALFARVRTLNAALWVTLVAAWATGGAAGFVEHRLARHFPAAWAEPVHVMVGYSFPAQLPVFCLGIVLYFLLAEPAGRRRVGGGLLVAVAAFAVFGPVGKTVVPAVAFVALAVGLAERPVGLLVNPVTRFLGRISFSAYIWHFTVMAHIAGPVVDRLGDRHWHLSPAAQYGAFTLVLLAATLPVATLSYHLIEVPGQSLGRRLINARRWGVARPTRDVAAGVPAAAVVVPA